eukprot:3718335-Rhodomonas_salina.1
MGTRPTGRAPLHLPAARRQPGAGTLPVMLASVLEGGRAGQVVCQLRSGQVDDSVGPRVLCSSRVQQRALG